MLELYLNLSQLFLIDILFFKGTPKGAFFYFALLSNGCSNTFLISSYG